MIKMKAATVFLDIDGVLNTKDSWAIPFQLNDKCIQAFCSTLLKHVAEPRIILTSSWKNGYSSIHENETPQLKELRKKLGLYGINIDGRTKALNHRMQEIDEYIRTHEVSTYAIIDDDPAEYTESYITKVTLINARTGFCENQKIKWNRA